MTCEALPANPWEKWGWAFASIWLVFLMYPIVAVTTGDSALGWKVLALACIAGFAVANVLGYSLWEDHTWRALGLMAVFALATVPIIGMEALAFTPYFAMLSALQLPAPWWQRTTTLAAALPLLALLDREGFPTYFFLMVWPVMLGGTLIRIFGDQEFLAGVARNQFALVEERERVARDVHDVLGHSLTVLSIKAELAGRLIDLDPERARAELASIQDTARQALAELRSTVGGLRAADFEAELAAAPQVLANAGIETRIIGDIADTDPRHRTLLAWVLRESVTNVVRHSRATTVTVELGPTGLVIADDGAGIESSGGREGNGLRGMRERVSASGGTLQLSGGPGTRLQVVLS